LLLRMLSEWREFDAASGLMIYGPIARTARSAGIDIGPTDSDGATAATQ